MRTTRLRILIALAVLATPCTGLARATLTVAKSGGADFTEIASAVSAASDGDVIVVAFGSYLPFTIDAKSLTIVAPNGAGLATGTGSSATEGGLITIRNLGAGQHCVIEDLALTNFSTAKSTVLVADCAGPVWLQHLFIDSYNTAGLVIERCASVVVNDCDIQTNTVPAAPTGTPAPRPGTRIVDSRVEFHSSSTKGSHGNSVGFGFPTPNAPAPGGPGLEVIDSHVEMSACVVQGGNGNSQTIGGCIHAGNGGVGIVLSSAESSTPPVVRLRETNVTGGSPGFYQAACAPPPAPGPSSAIDAGAIVTLSGPARRLIADGAVEAGSRYELLLAGAPFDQALLFAGAAALGLAVPGTAGASLHLTPSLVLGVVPLPAAGNITLGFSVPPLPPGSSGAVIGVQALSVAANATIVACGPLSITVLP